MYNYIPSMTVLLVSLVVVSIVFFLRLPLVVVALIAILLIVLSVNQHFALFATDYELLKSTQSLANWAPYIIVSVVIAFALGFLFLLSRSTPKTVETLTQNFTPPVATPINTPSPLNNLRVSRNNALISALNRAI